MVAHLLWEQEVAGSSPVSPTSSEAIFSLTSFRACQMRAQLVGCGSPDPLVEPSGERIVERWEQVAVTIQGNGDGAVPEALHDGLRVTASGDEQAGTGTSPVMPPGARHSSPGSSRDEVAAADRQVAHELPALPDEQSGSGVFGPGQQLGSEGFSKLVRQRHPPAHPGLRWGHHELASHLGDRLGDEQRRTGQVHRPSTERP